MSEGKTDDVYSREPLSNKLQRHLDTSKDLYHSVLQDRKDFSCREYYCCPKLVIVDTLTNKQPVPAVIHCLYKYIMFFPSAETLKKMGNIYVNCFAEW